MIQQYIKTRPFRVLRKSYFSMQQWPMTNFLIKIGRRSKPVHYSSLPPAGCRPWRCTYMYCILEVYTLYMYCKYMVYFTQYAPWSCTRRRRGGKVGKALEQLWLGPLHGNMWICGYEIPKCLIGNVRLFWSRLCKWNNHHISERTHRILKVLPTWKRQCYGNTVTYMKDIGGSRGVQCESLELQVAIGNCNPAHK